MFNGEWKQRIGSYLPQQFNIHHYKGKRWGLCLTLHLVPPTFTRGLNQLLSHGNSNKSWRSGKSDNDLRECHELTGFGSKNIMLRHSERCKLSPNTAPRSFVKFSELVRMLEYNGFTLIKEKGSIRYYGKPGIEQLVRIDYHGSKEVPTGTCHAILKAAGLKHREE
jgi:predicted RNA binding protein YcfA (HicA-like mRNA interferase family)